MKSLRLLPSLSLLTATTLLAAAPAAVIRIDGSPPINITEKERIPLTVAANLNDRTLVEVPPRSTLGLKFTNAASLYVDGKSLLRLHAAPDAARPPIIELMRGMIHFDGDRGGALDIRTAVATAYAARATRSAFSLSGDVESETMVIYAVNGDILVRSRGDDTTIPSGWEGVYTNEGRILSARIPEESLDRLRLSDDGYFGFTPPATPPAVDNPDTSKLGPPVVTALSPNGEGSIN